MNYEFPVGLSLEETREVIRLHNANTASQGYDLAAYIEADRGDYAVFNYLVSLPTNYPDPALAATPEEARRCAILRECRGLTFCTKTGKVLNRKFAKFFNVNEKPETQAGAIDWTQPHIVLEKLDGSMITPLPLGDTLRWATKMGLTEVAAPVEEFVSKHPEYATFARLMIEQGKTPIFEWCSRQQTIVLDYAVEQLVLTTIRDNHTGAITPYAEMVSLAEIAGLPVVKALATGVEDIAAFLEEVRQIKDAEGYVIRFENGHQVKVKGEWYCQIHRAKELIHREKDVLSLILYGNIDDAKPFLQPNDRNAVERLEADFHGSIASTAARLDRIVGVAKVTTGGEKKRFVMETVRDLRPAEFEQNILFSIWDGTPAREAVMRVVQKYIHPTAATQPRVNQVRHLFGGLQWSDYRETPKDE